MAHLIETSPSRWLLSLSVIIGVAIGVVTNKITNAPLPQWLEPWLTWNTLIILTLVLVIVNLLLESKSSASFESFIKKIIDLLKVEKDTQGQALHNRQVMLKAVKLFWVDGILKNSLHGAALIELGMEEKREALDYPWDMVLHTLGQDDRHLPSNTKMIDVFDQVGRSLLILGEPGSGKTTMLLELARQTIERAERDTSQPIPVVFNLSSWAEKRLSLNEWLISELETKYQIPKKIAQGWVDKAELLLLLDGLDEVALKHRAACVETINAFIKSCLMPLVVCSRVADYESLPVKLNLERAVLLQPLLPEQIASYLEQFEAKLTVLKKALKRDSGLRELAKSPLMLSIMVLAYGGVGTQKIPYRSSLEAQRKYVFEAYVTRMFERRTIRKSYPIEKTRSYLTWLARRMVEHSQSVFLIEQMQPSWLSVPGQIRIVKWSFVLILKLIEGLIFGLIGGLTMGLIVWPSSGLIVGLIIGLSFMLGIGLISGLTMGLIDGLIREWFGINSVITPVEKLKWSQKAVNQLFTDIPSVRLIMGLITGLTVGLMIGLIVGQISGLIVGSIVVLSFMLSTWLKYEDIETKITPNQSIWQSLKNAVIVGLSSGLIVGLSSGLVVGMIVGLGDGLIVGVFSGLSSGLMIGRIYGGRTCLQHFTLRLTLYFNDHIPWNYARFLDYCAERIFLRKVGSAYIFIHRYLMEYFASLEPEPPE